MNAGSEIVPFELLHLELVAQVFYILIKAMDIISLLGSYTRFYVLYILKPAAS